MFSIKLITRNPRKLRRHVDRLKRNRTALPKAGRHIHAGVNPPVATGELKASITAEQVERDVFHITAHAKHAKYVEYGTRHQRPQPFFRTAFRERRKGAVKIYARAIRRQN